MPALTVDDVHEHVSGICFKTGPPPAGVRTVGTETEWFVDDPRTPSAPVRVARTRALLAAAGLHPDAPLPHGGRITFEPGGQLEVSSAPHPGPAALHRAHGADLHAVRTALARGGLVLTGTGTDPLRPARLRTRAPRYRCMRAYLGPRGPAMMCSTASVQVCVDIGTDRADAVRRWRLAHRLSPVLVAAFANSPRLAGRATGLKSARQSVWWRLDPGRTTAPPGDGSDPAAEWTRYALGAGVMMLHTPGGAAPPAPGMTTLRRWIETGRPRPPTRDDLDLHLSTLFPPVRPRGWLELRMIDALPGRYWAVAAAVVAALLDDPRAADTAAAAVEPLGTAPGLALRAARDGLADPPIRRAARACFDAAGPALVRLGSTALVPLLEEYRARYTDRGRCPADDQAGRPAPHPADRGPGGGGAGKEPEWHP